jgi:uncharacterized membrane protein
MLSCNSERVAITRATQVVPVGDVFLFFAHLLKILVIKNKINRETATTLAIMPKFSTE